MLRFVSVSELASVQSTKLRQHRSVSSANYLPSRLISLFSSLTYVDLTLTLETTPRASKQKTTFKSHLRAKLWISHLPLQSSLPIVAGRKRQPPPWTPTRRDGITRFAKRSFLPVFCPIFWGKTALLKDLGCYQVAWHVQWFQHKRI